MNTSRIARNSLWYGLETGTALVSGIVTSILIARALGPVKLGHYTYIAWLVNITGNVGALGIPAAAGKYMGEYLGRGEAPVAKAVFYAALRLQLSIATLLTAVAISISYIGVDPGMRWTAILLSAAMWPAMVIWIPSEVNIAREDMLANVPSALLSNTIYIAGVIVTLTYSGDTLGLAATLLVMRTAELIARIIPVLGWMRTIPSASVPENLRKRLVNFSRQSTILLLLAIIVFDRSEVVFLRYFSDIRQLAFYTVVFNITERLRSLPHVFSTSVGATMLAQYGRNAATLPDLVSKAVCYLSLLCAPVYIGLAVVSRPALLLAYGSKYAEAIPLLSLACVLALPNVVLTPVGSLLAAADRQDLSIKWSLYMAALNLALDFVLIPKFGGMGAVIANGLAQTTAVVGLSWIANRAVHLHWPVSVLAKIGLASCAMATAILNLPLIASHGLHVVIGTIFGGIVYLAGIKLTRVLDESDRDRLMQLNNKLPVAFQFVFAKIIRAIGPQLRSEAAAAV